MRCSWRYDEAICQRHSLRNIGLFKAPVLYKFCIQTAFASMTDLFKKTPCKVGETGLPGLLASMVMVAFCCAKSIVMPVDKTAAKTYRCIFICCIRLLL